MKRKKEQRKTGWKGKTDDTERDLTQQKESKETQEEKEKRKAKNGKQGKKKKENRFR